MDSTISGTDIRDWKVDLRAMGRSPHTIAAYTEAATQFLNSSNGVASRAAVREYLASIEGKAPATRAARLIALRLFFEWCKAEEILDENPARNLKAPKVKAKPVEPITRQDIAAILKACRCQRDRALISLLASTGLRISELATITLDRLDLDKRTVLVLGKGSKWRVVPFSDSAAREVSKYLRERRRVGSQVPTDALWLGQQGPLSKRGIDHIIRTTARQAGVEGVFAHRYRHSFANSWLEDGGSEQALMTIAGWSSRSMLDRYSAAGAADRAMAEYHRLRH